MNECLQSIRLIYSCLKTMKSSRYNTDLGDHMQVMESMINCFKLSTEGYNLPLRTVYAIHEAPKGELGLILISG